MSKDINMAEVGVHKYGLTALFENIGEGLAGDYEPGDPNDLNLLRLRIFANGEEVEGTSSCTLMPASASASVQATALEHILDRIEQTVPGLANMEEPYPGSLYKLCEALSWISPTNMTP